jgi:transposase InsO family protein
VSRSGYYVWRTRGPSRREREDESLVKQIETIHRQSHGTYGSPRVWRELQALKRRVGRCRIERLMRSAGICGVTPRPYRVTTDSGHALPIAPNRLLARSSPKRLDEVWAGDITYLRTAEGWPYLSVVLDLYSRRVIGWSVSQGLETQLPEASLMMALRRRGIARGCVHHSDRGSQYASRSYRRLAEAHGLDLSMSRKGNCWDNAAVESFFATLKKELVYPSRWRTRHEASKDLYEYIEVFYNRYRLHSSLGYQSPVVFEQVRAQSNQLNSTVH